MYDIHLTSAKGVAEVASIGGFVKEYQIDIDPNAMKAHGVNVAQIMAAVKNSNLDIGARTIEFNRVEYLVGPFGYIKNLEDLEESVVAFTNNVPIRLKDVAKLILARQPAVVGWIKEVPKLLEVLLLHDTEQIRCRPLKI